MDDRPHSHNLRKGRCSESGRIYLVTTVTRDRIPWFHDLLIARRVVQALLETHHRGWCETLAYVVMPDHLHWLLVLGDNQTLSNVVGGVKSVCAHRIGRCIWQAGFHDHAVRREEDLRNLGRYVVMNPLRAGLVNSLRDYPHWDAIWLPGD
jgi:REP element-mobilizing transposase RayT